LSVNPLVLLPVCCLPSALGESSAWLHFPPLDKRIIAKSLFEARSVP
jgi:hypothetical protein